MTSSGYAVPQTPPPRRPTRGWKIVDPHSPAQSVTARNSTHARGVSVTSSTQPTPHVLFPSQIAMRNRRARQPPHSTTLDPVPTGRPYRNLRDASRLPASRSAPSTPIRPADRTALKDDGRQRPLSPVETDLARPRHLPLSASKQLQGRNPITARASRGISDTGIHGVADASKDDDLEGLTLELAALQSQWSDDDTEDQRSEAEETHDAVSSSGSQSPDDKSDTRDARGTPLGKKDKRTIAKHQRLAKLLADQPSLCVLHGADRCQACIKGNYMCLVDPQNPSKKACLSCGRAVCVIPPIRGRLTLDRALQAMESAISRLDYVGQEGTALEVGALFREIKDDVGERVSAAEWQISKGRKVVRFRAK